MADLILLSDWQKSQFEFWLPVPNVPHYDVSTFGRIRSYFGKKRGVAWKDAFTHYVADSPTRILNPKPNKSHGYVEAYLRSGGRGKNFRAHRLVAAAFLPNPGALPEVNHKNGIKTDNRLDNLEWATSKENHRHAAVTGLRARGEGHGMSKLSEASVRAIRALAAKGVSPPKIAARYDIDTEHARRVIRGEAWRHVE